MRHAPCALRPMPFALSALCPLPFALCSLPFAPCLPRGTFDYLTGALCSMRFTQGTPGGSIPPPPTKRSGQTGLTGLPRWFSAFPDERHKPQPPRRCRPMSVLSYQLNQRLYRDVDVLRKADCCFSGSSGNREKKESRKSCKSCLTNTNPVQTN